VRDTNTGAAAMYERMGFTRVPERDWSPREGVDLLALTRPIG
jgi:ribosomal protein S18 acetylase RimI-like enzyme